MKIEDEMLGVEEEALQHYSDLKKENAKLRTILENIKLNTRSYNGNDATQESFCLRVIHDLCESGLK